MPVVASSKRPGRRRRIESRHRMLQPAIVQRTRPRIIPPPLKCSTTRRTMTKRSRKRRRIERMVLHHHPTKPRSTNHSRARILLQSFPSFSCLIRGRMYDISMLPRQSSTFPLSVCLPPTYPSTHQHSQTMQRCTTHFHTTCQ